MYVFRSRNTRDERFPSKEQIFAKTVPTEGFKLADDDELCFNEERDYVEYFHEKLLAVLSDYLVTENGRAEVDHLRNELGQSRLTGVPLRGKHATAGWMPSLFQEKAFDHRSLVDQDEAIKLIIESGLRNSDKSVRAEYRIVHPPRFVCIKCQVNFKSAKELGDHSTNTSVHLASDLIEADAENRLLCVGQMFRGNKGRTLTANRQMFSTDFTPSASELSLKREMSVRPLLADHGGVRARVQAQGHILTGFDPSQGVRPICRTQGMAKQHKLPIDISSPKLKDLLLSLSHLRNGAERHDFVTTSAVGEHVSVRFMWKGLTSNMVQLKGDFTGWSPVELKSVDQNLGKNCMIQPLSAGKYRYCYVVDGQDRVDEEASTIEHGEGIFNVISVLNPPTSKAMSERTSPSDSTSCAYDYDGPLKDIDLRSSSLCDDGVWALSDQLHYATDVQRIDLSSNNISDEGMQALSQALKFLPNLHTLNLNNNGFAFDGSRYLTAAIGQVHAIKHLQLSNNRLGADGAEAISGLIQFSHQIEVIYLDENMVGDEGVRHISDAVRCCRTLRQLSLNANNITSVGISLLSSALHYNCALTTLSLRHNPLGAEGGRILADLLIVNKCLRNLDISYTDLMRDDSNRGIQAIGYSLGKNKYLRVLKVSGNNINDVVCGQLAFALLDSRGIVELDLSGNSLLSRWFRPILGLCVRNKPSKEGKKIFVKTRQLGKSVTVALGDKYTDSLSGIFATMPTIYDSLERNKSQQLNPALAKLYARTYVDIEDGFEGIWKNSYCYKWELLDKSNQTEALKQLKNQDDEEQVRMDREEAYVTTQLNIRQAIVKDFLEGTYGYNYVHAVAKHIIHHIELLSKIVVKNDPETILNPDLETHSPTETTPSIKPYKSHISGDLTDSETVQQSPLQLTPTSGLQQNSKTIIITKNNTKKNSEHKCVTHQNTAENTPNTVTTPLEDFNNPSNDEVKPNEGALNNLKNGKSKSIVLRRIERRKKKSLWGEQLNENNANNVDDVSKSIQNDNTNSNLKLNCSSSDIDIDQSEKRIIFPMPNLITLTRDGSDAMHEITTKTKSAIHLESMSKKSESPSNVVAISKNLSILQDKNISSTKIRHKENIKNSEIFINTPEIDLDSAETRSPIKSSFVELKVQGPRPIVVTMAPTLFSSSKTFHQESFQSTHTVIMTALFKQFGATQKSLILPHEKLLSLFSSIALSLSFGSEEYSQVLKETLIPNTKTIGLSRTSAYVLKNASRIAGKNFIARRSAIAALKISPPLTTASSIILEHSAHADDLELRKEYRILEGNEPLYLCRICGSRFSSVKMLDFHTAKGGTAHEHRLLLSSKLLFERQCSFLQDVKYSISGRTFPSYYSLVNEKSLPGNYYPQVMDAIGDAGRPVGVIEGHMVIRAEDMLGDYLKVHFHGKKDLWIRHKKGKKKILEPACESVPGFSWDGLIPYNRPEFHQVRTDLPLGAELKVRHSPLSFSPVCGQIKAGQIIEVWARFGVWLQIKYEDIPCAWVLRSLRSDSSGSEGANGGKIGNLQQVVADMILSQKEIDREINTEKEKEISREKKLIIFPSISNLSPEKKSKNNNSTEDSKYIEMMRTQSFTKPFRSDRDLSPTKDRNRSNNDKNSDRDEERGRGTHVHTVDLGPMNQSDYRHSGLQHASLPHSKSGAKSVRRNRPATDHAGDSDDEAGVLTLIRRLHPYVQLRLESVLTKSPYDPTPSDLIVDPKYDSQMLKLSLDDALY